MQTLKTRARHWRWAVGIIAAATVTFAAAAARQKPAPSSTMVALTALDYIEIQQLVARYAHAIDSCSNNGYDYADLYTADGWFAASRNGTVGPRQQGREKLAEAAGGGSRGCEKLARPQGLWIHAMINHEITASPEGATGVVDLVYPVEHGKGFDADHSGHVGRYEDVYVKTPTGWRFKSRIHVMPPQPDRPDQPSATSSAPSR